VVTLLNQDLTRFRKTILLYRLFFGVFLIFFPNRFVAARLSQAGTHPAAVVTAILAGKAILARILFRALPASVGDIHFTL
jgi:ABC-type transport system involved in Fe-S cluster assembly fused permease/ATPase subunit